MLEIGMNQTKGILAKAGSVPWLAWHHSQTSICTGRGKTGVRRWGCCIKPGLMPDTLCWPTKGRSHFFFRYSQMCEYAFLVLHVWFEFPMEQAVGEDAASGGCASKTYWKNERLWGLQCLFINHNDSRWLTFTYLNVKIACVLRGTSDSGCGFTSGHFLINGWTVLGLVKTQWGNTTVLHLCVPRD